MSRLRYPKEILDSIFTQALSAFPSECCGLLSGYRVGQALEAVAIHEMDNAYDRYHAADPEAYPRTSRTAYLMDPQKQARLMATLEKHGTPALCIYHSHADAGAYFSEEDQRMALWDTEPLFPGLEYLVLSVQRGEIAEARSFAWNGQAFVGRDVPLGGE